MLNRLVVLVALFLPALSALSQEVAWRVDMSAVFNNREGGDEQRPDQTFLFTRLEGDVGVSLLDGAHQVRGGAAWYQPINDGCGGYRIDPTLYYVYRHRRDNRQWLVSLGALPRSLMAGEVPRYLWSDSLNYCQSNIRGALVQYTRDSSFVEMMLDWRQMQTERRREAFNVLFNARWHVGGPWSVGGHLQYNHLAKRKHADDSEGVNDDATINPMCYARWTALGRLDFLEVQAGAVLQLQRARVDHRWRTPAGFVGTVALRWRWLEASEHMFAGNDLMPLYPRFGSQLNLGDPYYRSHFYSRTDVRAHVVQNRFVDLSAQLTFHATDRITGFWQQLSCRVFLDPDLWRHRRDRAWLNAERLKTRF